MSKIRMIQDVEIETVGHNEAGYKSREQTLLRKGDVFDLQIVKEKKGVAEVLFSDGSTGKIQMQHFEKV